MSDISLRWSLVFPQVSGQGNTHLLGFSFCSYIHTGVLVIFLIGWPRIIYLYIQFLHLNHHFGYRNYFTAMFSLFCLFVFQF